ncbi:MAG: hypothetical protein QFX32_02435 [Methanolinea sp.]|nr:hypothetical protein [Methanolinea sp.]
MKSSIIVTCLLIVGAIAGNAWAAEAPPGPNGSSAEGPGTAYPLLPHSFYGSVSAAGSPVPDGVRIEATGPGVRGGVPGNPVYTCEGKYGSPDPFAQRLEVQGTMEPGTELAFLVGGVRAEVRPAGQGGEWMAGYPYSPGEVTALDLRVSVPVTPDPDFRGAGGSPVSASHGTSPGQVPGKPSSTVLVVLAVILAVLGGAAFVLGRRAERERVTKGGGEPGGENEEEGSGEG